MDIRKIIRVLVLLCFIPTNFYASKIIYTARYKLIDSLSQGDNSRFVNLDIKTKKINIIIGNQMNTFIQEYGLDSTQKFVSQNLICKLEKEYIVLHILELKRVENDSIYVSATYQKFNEKGNVGKMAKIKNLAINKSELLGVIISPPINGIKKNEKKYYWLVGILTATITTLAIVFGH